MSKMFEMKRGVQDSINIIKRNIKVHVFEEDNSVYRSVAVELRKLLLDKNASATFIDKGQDNNKSLFELYYGDGTGILLQSFLNPREETKKTESNSYTVTSAFYGNRIDILKKPIGKNNLVSLTQWLDEPLFYHNSKAQTLRAVLNHIAGKEGSHIINPRKNDITSFAIAVLEGPITPSNLPLLVASNDNWNQLIIDAGMRLLNARKASDKNFLIKHGIVVPKNYSLAQSKFYRGQNLMKEAEQQVNTENKNSIYKEAIKVFDEAINLNFKNANIYHNRGAAKSHLGWHADAIDDYNKAIDLKPYNALFYSNRGITKSHLGQHTDAINDCDEAIKLNPNEAIAYNNRGIAKSRFGWHTDAIDDFSKTIKLKPDYASAYRNRGIARAKAKLKPNQYNEIILDLEKAIELDSNLESELRSAINELKSRNPTPEE